tara:strand:- start:77 stop:205 length:129 start_codon:yes stop_codon:yes gene_type:complete
MAWRILAVVLFPTETLPATPIKNGLGLASLAKKSDVVAWSLA